MTMRELTQQEIRLSERVSKLNEAISTAEAEVNENNIEEQAEELNSLHVQKKLTEVALRNTQEKLTAYKKLAGSKEYKDKLKEQEKLREQAQKETIELFELLTAFKEKAENVFKLCKQYDKLEHETSKFDTKLIYKLSLERKQPFSWLRAIYSKVRNALKDTKYIADKLEV